MGGTSGTWIHRSLVKNLSRCWSSSIRLKLSCLSYMSMTNGWYSMLVKFWNVKWGHWICLSSKGPCSNTNYILALFLQILILKSCWLFELMLERYLPLDLRCRQNSFMRMRILITWILDSNFLMLCDNGAFCSFKV